MASDGRGGIGSIASVFEKASSPPPVSAVSSLTSKFDAAEKSRDQGKVSSKISSVAEAFELKKQPSSGKKTPLYPGTAAKDAKDPAEAPITRASSSSFNEAAKRFQSGETALKEEKENAPQSAFRTASAAFEERQKSSSPAPETKVSAFAQKLDKAAKTSPDPHSLKPPKEFGRATSSPNKDKANERSKSTERTLLRGVSASAATIDCEKPKPSDASVVTEGENLRKDRFKEATSLFNVEDNKVEKLAGDEDSAGGSSRFADAARKFGGSMK